MARLAGWVLLLSAAVCAQDAVAATDGATQPFFPAELQGTWNPAPYDCSSTAAAEAENDMRFELSGQVRNNFEDIEQVIAVRRVVDMPATWQVISASNVVGDEDGHSVLYVLGDRYLFVTDGHRMDEYVRCN
jgi:hypothetical protein